MLFLQNMKKRQYISFILLIVSILMLTASVMPHHHHQEIICLQHDVTECQCNCNSNSNTHSHAEDMNDENHSCNTLCITKFNSINPDRVSDLFTADVPIFTLLYSINDIFNLSLPDICERVKLPYYYLEHLHSTSIPQVVGLRAPPCEII